MIRGHPLRRALLAWALGCGIAGTAGATRWIRQDSVNLHTNEVWNEEVALVAGDARLDGIARRDLFLAGRSAQLGGQFGGDVWAYASARAEWRGIADDDLRIMSPFILFQGTATRRVYLAGGTVKIESPARVGRETDIVADDVIFQGEADGPLKIRARRVTLGGHVRGPVDLQADDIVIQPGTTIEGYLRYASPSTLAVPADAQVKGEVMRVTPPSGAGAGYWTGMIGVAFGLMNLVLALVVPGPMRRAADRIHSRPAQCVLIGAAGGMAVPAAAALLGASLVGIPLAVILGSSALAAFVAGPAITAAALGARLGAGRHLSARRALFNQSALGLLLLAIAAFIPVIGPSLLLLAAAAGAGALFLALRGAPESAPPAGE